MVFSNPKIPSWLTCHEQPYWEGATSIPNDLFSTLGRSLASLSLNIIQPSWQTIVFSSKNIFHRSLIFLSQPSWQNIYTIHIPCICCSRLAVFIASYHSLSPLSQPQKLNPRPPCTPVILQKIGFRHPVFNGVKHGVVVRVEHTK